MLKYHHRQFGTVVVVIGGLTLILLLSLLVFVEANPIGIAVLILVAVCLALFPTLTVDVTAEEILIYFGPGLIRKRFSLDSIKSARKVRNKWYFGWGIRIAPHCWLYNVSGLDSVEIELENGRRYRIGTDEPDVLLEEIEKTIGGG